MTPKHIGLMLVILIVLGALVTVLGTTAQRHVTVEYPRVPATATDDPAKKLTISWLAQCWYAGAKKGTLPEQFVEKTFNVDIQPIFLDGNASDNRRPLMFSAGEIPDLVYESDPITVQRYAREGFYCEVPYSLILKYAPTYAKNLNDYAPAAWLYSYWNGKNWGLPGMWLWGRYPGCPVWRKDWLEKVGIHKIPETLDEFHEALYRFRHNDPDGDGKMDTYGTTVRYEAWYSAFSEIFGAFGNQPYIWQFDKDGKVVWGGLQPEAKEALAVLHKWYTEEIIDPDFVTDQTPEDKLVSGKIGYQGGLGYNFALFDPGSSDATRKSFYALHPQGELVAGPLPSGPHGQRESFTWGGGGNILCFGPDVAKHPEKFGPPAEDVRGGNEGLGIWQ